MCFLKDIPATWLIASTFCAAYIYRYKLYSFYILIFAWTRCRSPEIWWTPDTQGMPTQLEHPRPNSAYKTRQLETSPGAELAQREAHRAWGGGVRLSPRIDSKPYPITGCGQTDVYWLLEAFKLLYWGSRCSASALCETCLVFSTNWYDICGFIHGSIHEGGETTKTLEYSWSTSEGIWNFLFRCRVISQLCAVKLKSLDNCLQS